MRRLKKAAAAVCAAVLTVGMAVTAYALPSVTVNGVVEAITSAVTVSGETLAAQLGEVEMENYSEEQQAVINEVRDAKKLQELLGEQYEDGMQVVDLKDVAVPEGTVFPVTVLFRVNGVQPDSRVAVLHYSETENRWELVASEVTGDETVKAVFESLSPVAFVVDQESAGAAAVSPKTGESALPVAAGAAAVVAAGGMLAIALSAKRKAV